MFNLIIGIISIGLLAATALAGLYYGGDSFTQGRAKALASTVISQAQQISAANSLYRTDNAGDSAADVAALITSKYLQAAPQLPGGIAAASAALDLNGTSVEGVLTSASVCALINQQIDSTFDLATTIATLPVTQQYGCTTAVSGGVMTFTFRG